MLHLDDTTNSAQFNVGNLMVVNALDVDAMCLGVSVDNMDVGAGNTTVGTTVNQGGRRTGGMHGNLVLVPYIVVLDNVCGPSGCTP